MTNGAPTVDNGLIQEVPDSASETDATGPRAFVTMPNIVPKTTSFGGTVSDKKLGAQTRARPHWPPAEMDPRFWVHS